MKKYDNCTIENEAISLEEVVLKNCTIKNCVVIYRGGGFVIDGCSFENCQTLFQCEAINTINLLQTLGLWKSKTPPSQPMMVSTQIH